MAIITVHHGLRVLTGGAANALDAIDGNSLLDGDEAVVMSGGNYYIFLMDAVSGAAENSPYVIAPDTNAGTKRWILQAPPGVTYA